MEEWKEYKLSELGAIIGGATPSTKDSNNYDGEISWITPKDLSNYNNRYIFRGERMITRKGYDSCSCKMLPQGSVLFSSRAPIGYVAIAGNELCTNQGFKSIVPDNTKVNSMFVYYLLIYNKNKIEGMGTGTTFKEVSGSVMRNVAVKVPSLPTQQKIANILSSLDDKIEVNRRINEQLEELAQALFKSWFVDFEPFKDGEFVESELGMIPEGWKIVDLKEFCIEIVRGYTPKYAEFSDYPILNQKVNKGDKLEKQYYKYNKNDDSVPLNKMAQRGDVYLNSLGQGTLGRIHLYKDELSNVIVDQFITILRTDSFIKSAYLASILKSPIYQNEIESRITGSTGMWVLTINNIRNIKIVQPLNSLWQQLENIIEPIYRQIAINEKENEHLTNLRDTLLPKLMSGEIDVNEVEI